MSEETLRRAREVTLFDTTLSEEEYTKRSGETLVKFLDIYARKLRLLLTEIARHNQDDIHEAFIRACTVADPKERSKAAWHVLAWNIMVQPDARMNLAKMREAIKADPLTYTSWAYLFPRPMEEVYTNLRNMDAGIAENYKQHCLFLEVAKNEGLDLSYLVPWD